MDFFPEGRRGEGETIDRRNKEVSKEEQKTGRKEDTKEERKNERQEGS